MVDVEVLRNVQQRLSRYIYAKGFLSWNGIRKACNRIILALPENEQENFKNKTYPEFDIFLPLLRNGSAEVCRSNERASLLYCMNPNTNLITSEGNEFIRGQEFFSIYRTKEDLLKNNKKYREDVESMLTFDSLSFLKSYTSLQQQITSYAEEQIQVRVLHYEQNLASYQYEKKDTQKIDIGIYKLDDKAWTSPYLLDKQNKIRKIPYYADDPDSMNLARLYVRTNNPTFTKPIFEYDINTQELFCNRYSEMPILLSRALILFEPKQLISKEFCTNYPSVPFKNVPKEGIKELKRIFSDKTVLIK
jgi:hypothetical protein